MDKKELRAEVRKIISNTDDEYFVPASEEISEKVIRSDAFKNCRTLFIYTSTEKEPATDEIIKKALADGKTVCVPKCISKSEMLAIKINNLDELKTGYYGIREPESEENSVSAEDFDLAVIPCVAASYSKKRLGHGAGYYDRFLPKMTAHKMCLCFDRLIFQDIPTDIHDIKMDSVITEKCSVF